MSLVKIATTAAQKKLLFNLRRLKSEVGLLEESDLTPELVGRIASSLDVHRPKDCSSITVDITTRGVDRLDVFARQATLQ